MSSFGFSEGPANAAAVLFSSSLCRRFVQNAGRKSGPASASFGSRGASAGADRNAVRAVVCWDVREGSVAFSWIWRRAQIRLASVRLIP